MVFELKTEVCDESGPIDSFVAQISDHLDRLNIDDLSGWVKTHLLRIAFTNQGGYRPNPDYLILLEEATERQLCNMFAALYHGDMKKALPLLTETIKQCNGLPN